MKLNAGMIGAGEATAAKNTDVEAEVSPVLLSQYIGGHLGGTENGVGGAINAAFFANPIPIGGVRVVVSSGGFRQGDFVGRVTVHFVGAEKNEARFGTELAHRFENVGRAQGVDFEIHEGDFASLVVRGLRGAMENRVEGIVFEEGEDAVPIADVEIVMFEPGGNLAESGEIPGGIALGPEELAAHVVVNADDAAALAVKVFDGLGADQATAAGDENVPSAHAIPLAVGSKVLIIRRKATILLPER